MWRYIHTRIQQNHRHLVPPGVFCIETVCGLCQLYCSTSGHELMVTVAPPRCPTCMHTRMLHLHMHACSEPCSTTYRVMSNACSVLGRNCTAANAAAACCITRHACTTTASSRSTSCAGTCNICEHVSFPWLICIVLRVVPDSYSGPACTYIGTVDKTRKKSSAYTSPVVDIWRALNTLFFVNLCVYVRVNKCIPVYSARKRGVDVIKARKHFGGLIVGPTKRLLLLNGRVYYLRAPRSIPLYKTRKKVRVPERSCAFMYVVYMHVRPSCAIVNPHVRTVFVYFYHVGHPTMIFNIDYCYLCNTR